jgi:HK97 family phage major capsid protein
MSPRVKPKRDRARARAFDSLEAERDFRAASRDAAAEFKAASEQALEDAAARHGLSAGRVGRTAYDEAGNEHSFFRDLAVSVIDDMSRTTRGSDGRLLVELGGNIPHPVHGGADEARARLASVQGESRAMTTAATAGGNFVINVAPRYVADAFSEMARNTAVLAGLLPQEDLPAEGLDVYVARMTTGTSVAVQATQNTSLSNTDPVEAKSQTSPVAMIAGYVDLSLQLFEKAAPRIADIVLARDLGRALASELDRQLLVGTGANGQVLGLNSTTGIGTTSYTAGTPSQAAAYPKIMSAAADLSVALGVGPDVILFHPRRSAWFFSYKDSSTGELSPIRWPCRVVDTPCIPINSGAGTNEDSIWVLRTDELPICLGPVAFEIFPEINSASGTVRFSARQYAASLFGRRPEAVQKISGSGLAGVVFS